MNVRRLITLLLVVFCPACWNVLFAQSVSDLFRSDRALADQHFLKGNFRESIRLYERANKSHGLSNKIGRIYYLLKEYEKSAAAYEAYRGSAKKLDNTDLMYYAEVQLTLKHYRQAEQAFRELASREPGNPWLIKKIWRIANLHYLFEDSIHFAVRPLNINSTSGEWGAVPFGNSILFLSNRPTGNPVDQLDAATRQSFYRMYRTVEKPDTLLDGWSKLYGKVTLYEKSTANTGSYCLYENHSKIIFTATSPKKNARGIQTLGLYFGGANEKGWTLSRAFEHNTPEWSLKDPTLDTINQVLYFASDQKGGFGGMDLYRSRLINGRWSEPENLGESVNTPGDEIFPHIRQGVLYFSSGGQPGMGGLDIFKIYMNDNVSDEPVNLGYPINSSGDDFSIVFTDARATHGFLSSNRKAGGLDDDIYEFDMDMQSYPFEITGIVRQMDHTWNRDSGEAIILKNARIQLIDNIRKVVVQETHADSSGVFILRIPYFSKYAIQVTDAEGIENVAVFEVPRQRKESAIHEIVVVKDIFQSVTK